jgi:hypothetical protein
MTREELLNSAEYWQEMAENECWREGIECKIHLTDNQWHNVKDELPPKDPEIKSQTLSIPVLVTDGKICQVCRYDFISNSWAIQNIEITHWTKLPILPKKED